MLKNTLIIGIFLFVLSCHDKHIYGKINNVPYQLILSKSYSASNNKNKLLIYIPGNNQSYMAKPSPKALEYLLNNGYSYATIQIQDQSSVPFKNSNSGWGNEVAYKRVLKLYQYLMKNYSFDKNIVLAGGSMGGLTMGQIIVKGEIPVKTAIGIGAVPSLQQIWLNAPQRRVAIRNSYHIKQDGTEDFILDSIFAKEDWFCTINKTTAKLPDVYLYYAPDDTFKKEFGGVKMYKNLKEKFKCKGVNVIIKCKKSTDHADPSLYEIAINDGVFE